MRTRCVYYFARLSREVFRWRLGHGGARAVHVTASGTNRMALGLQIKDSFVYGAHAYCRQVHDTAAYVNELSNLQYWLDVRSESR
jgi:hypothetical protein